MVLGLVALSMAGCATGATGPAGVDRPASVPPPAPAGGAVVAVIGTPFFFLFKTVVCGATLVVAPPISALVALTDREDKESIRRRLDEGTTMNCFGPYWLSSSSR